MEEVWTAATAEKDTGAVINLLAGLSVVNETTELTGLVDVSALLDYLKTDAEEILIGEYEGYYGGKTGSIDSSYENDKIWDAYLPGDYVHSSFSSVDYYGDLASYFYSSGGVYRDENGKVHGNTASESYSTYVELKGERISFESVENCIKYAHEEDMTNYHKDGYCFAIGDTTFVCYVGGEIVFQFATPDK